MGGHSHDGAMLLVNPHADQELMYQGSVGLWLFDRVWRVAARFDGQSVTNDHRGEAHSYVATGVDNLLQVSQRLGLRVFGMMPVTTPGRMDWRIGVGAIVSLSR